MTAKYWKTWLAMAGVSALVALSLLQDNEQDNDKKPVILNFANLKAAVRSKLIRHEIAGAKAGDEIISLRGKKSKVHKEKDGRFSSTIYTERKHYLAADGFYKDIDLTVYDIVDSLRTHKDRKFDEYVNAGLYRATWFKGKKQDYTLYVDNYYVTYKALFDTAEHLNVEVEPTVEGIKESVILKDEYAPVNLSWIIETNAFINNDSGAIVFKDSTDSFLFQIPEPTAWDDKGQDIPVSSKLSSDTLYYSVQMPAECSYPITVDPSTLVVTAPYYSSGEVQSGDATYTTARNTAAGDDTLHIAYTGQNLSAGTFYVYRSFLSFDTAALPYGPATIDSAKLHLKVHAEYTGGSNFQSYLLGGTFSGEIATNWFNDFTGWQASGTYFADITSLADSINSASYAAGDSCYFTLNSDGLAAISISDTTRFAILSNEDIKGSEPAGAEYWLLSSALTGFPYLKVWYHYNYNTATTDSVSVSDFYTSKGNKDADYASVRDAIDLAYISTTTIDSLGQWKDSEDLLHVYRSNMEFYLSMEMDYAANGSLFVNLVTDVSDSAEFDLQLFGGEWTGGANVDVRYWLFDGHGSGVPHTGTRLNDVWNTASFSAGVLRIPLNSDGLAALVAASLDTLRLVLISSRDSSNTAPTGEEFLVLDPTSAQLKFDYMLTSTKPTDFTVSPSNATSIIATWTDNSRDETGFRIIDANTGAYKDSTNSTTGYGVDSSLVGFWTLAEADLKDSDTFYDYGSGNNNGDSQNTPVFATDENSKSNEAMEFNGSSNYIDCGTAVITDFDTGDPFSVSFWMKSTDTSGPGIISRQIGISGVDINWIIYLSVSGNIRAQGSSVNADDFKASWDTNVIDGNWHHIVFVYGGNHGDVYVDNDKKSIIWEAEGGDDGNFYARGASANLYIGVGVWDAKYEGDLSKMKIYDWALTVNDISILYNRYAYDTEIKVIGLTPNTLYSWEAQVIGGVAADSTSNADSLYTDAAAPVNGPALTAIGNTAVKVVIDTTGTGNPSDTEYAIYFKNTSNQKRWVDATAEPETLRVASDALELDEDWGWRTYDQWNAAVGDTTTGLYPGHQDTVFVEARNKDLP